MITDKLKEILATRIKDIVDVGKLGMGGNTTSPLALDLDVPLTTVTPTVEKSNTNVVQIMVEEVGSNITGKLIREMAFFDGTDMLGRVNFEAVGPFSGTERIQIFLTLEVE